MQLNMTDHVWSVSELITAAASGEVQERVGRAKRQFHVIDGGMLEAVIGQLHCPSGLATSRVRRIAEERNPHRAKPFDRILWV